MSFFSEIASAAGLSELKLSQGYSVVNYNGEAIYIEGVVRLLSVETESIKLELRGAIATLTGTNLIIFELTDTVIIKGAISNLDFTPYKNTGRANRREKQKTRG